MKTVSRFYSWLEKYIMVFVVMDVAGAFILFLMLKYFDQYVSLFQWLVYGGS